MRRSKKRQHESTTSPSQRSVDARQLSPGMDDYGMHDRHMDGLEGDDDDQPSPSEANFSFDANAMTLPTPNSDNQPSARRAECWQHFEVFTEMVDGKSIPRAQCKYCDKILSAATSSGTGHLNRHYLAHLKNKAPAGARQKQLSFGSDGSVSTWIYDPKIAREEIAKFIIAEDLPIRMGESKHFERMIQKAFRPQYKKVSRKTTKNDITAIYHSKLSIIVPDKLLNKIHRSVRIIGALVFDENRSDRILSSIVKPMEENFPKYFTSIPHLYYFALILDPRKKLEIAKVAMNSIGDAVGLDYSEAFQHVNDELYRVFHLYRTKLGGTPRVPEQTSQKKARKSSAINLWKQYIGNDQASPSSENKSTWNPDSELNHYLVTNHTKHDPTLGGDDVDLLGWWKEKERTLPVLAHFARDILLVPASFVSSEQAFSVTGIIREKRTKVMPDSRDS
ncbi:hypothetical protein OsI_07300 [Oryza sativa Indica Group]|uniref:BED-type domain-containing protein n=1 Tax=Oryza sativa subsp. indica TaxID=39946 RepID=B8AIA0_ORYSI|nr:hypothetical protein OsI_07300 [Oryza sativa Indica Group]